MSLVSFQAKQKTKAIKFTYSLQCILLLSGCSGSNPYFFSHESASTYQRQDQAIDYSLHLGLAYLAAHDMVNAKIKLFEAEQRKPNDPHIKSIIAYLLEHIGEFEKAELYHLKALKINQTQGAIHNNYGRFLCQCKRYEEAETHFIKAIQDPHYANTGRTYENAGLCAMRIPDYSKAIHYLKIAVKHNPRLEKSWLALATLHEQQPLLAHRYLHTYQTLSLQDTPTSLALGIKITRQDNKEIARRYAMALQEKYPHSREYQKTLLSSPELFNKK